MQTFIDHELHQYWIKTFQRPSFIVMHPKLWENLVNSIPYPNKSVDFVNATDLKYKGISVLRSLDCEEALIHIG